MTEHRSLADALQAFEDRQQLVLSCVARSVFIRGRRQSGDEGMRAFFLPQAPVLLTGRSALGLDASVLYRTDHPSAQGTWAVRTVGYRYQLYLPSDVELLAYHWHPEDPNPVKTPHLHLSAGARVVFDDISRAHIPTGLVQLHDVIGFVIEELGVRPLRPDWLAILSGLQG